MAYAEKGVAFQLPRRVGPEEYFYGEKPLPPQLERPSAWIRCSFAVTVSGCHSEWWCPRGCPWWPRQSCQLPAEDLEEALLVFVGLVADLYEYPGPPDGLETILRVPIFGGSLDQRVVGARWLRRSLVELLMVPMAVKVRCVRISPRAGAV